MSLLIRVVLVWITLLSAVQAAEDHAAIRKALAAVIPGTTPDTIRPAAIPGLFEVTYGPQVLYISEDGRFLVQGHVIDLDTRTDLTEERQGQLRNAALARLGEDKMVIFPAAKPRHTITVFTDIDCGYCQKLHNEIKEINALGITVRYLFFPRSGPNTESYYKAQSVWCAADRRQALTNAKAGQKLARATCDTPIDEHMKLVRQFGLQGTPAIVFEDGQVVPGYVPAKQLAAMLDENAR
ncbi:MAG: bifunctional protein-disulfide isomerase/oxidoreductase DsbC [Thiohalobacteraceae bacterium]|nr:bifunctional protein-disulfide isomerase/oxidoreductase DsbC [Gammaproteobacteria bacterium]